ncbi:MAG: hypothetical protein RLY64_367, partial [Bacteroidota bacterium]
KTAVDYFLKIDFINALFPDLDLPISLIEVYPRIGKRLSQRLDCKKQRKGKNRPGFTFVQ